jgi:hypothetical protein
MVAAQREYARGPRSAKHKEALARHLREIWQEPEKHGLPPRHHWTDAEIALLGTKPDPAIAKEMGVPAYVVANKRRLLGIRGIMKRWTESQIALLGTDKDAVIARILGMNTGAVTRKRVAIGVPPFVARWSDAEKALLGTDTDRFIAELLGRSVDAVESQRLHLGIPAYR